MTDVRNDEPVDSIVNDMFGFSFQASVIAKLVGGTKSQDHLSVGVSGSWGSGKTSLLNMVRELLKYKQHKDEKEKLEKILFTKTYYRMNESHRSELDHRIIYIWALLLKLEQEKIELDDSITEEVKVIWFDPWFFGSEETVIKAFFYRIAKELMDEDKELAKLFLKLAVVMSSSPDLPDSLPVVGNAFKVINYGRNLLSWMSGDDGSVMDFTDIKRKICERLKTKDFSYLDDDDDKVRKTRKRIVIIIDDLDRLQVDEALTMLKVIRLVSEFGVNFVIGYDEETLSETIDQKCGNHGREFIRKMVNIPMYISYWNHYSSESMPFIRYNKYDLYDKFSREMTSREDNIKTLLELIESLILTPRETINIFNLTHIIYLSNIDNVSVVDFFLLCMLRIYFPRIFLCLKDKRWPFVKNETQRLSFIKNKDKYLLGESTTEVKTEQVPNPYNPFGGLNSKIPAEKERTEKRTMTNEYKPEYKYLIITEINDYYITKIMRILQSNNKYNSLLITSNFSLYFGLLPSETTTLPNMLP